MQLKISNRLLQKNSVFYYIAKHIKNKEDKQIIMNALSYDEISDIFYKYFDGWLYDDAIFLYGDIDLILYWMKLNPKS